MKTIKKSVLITVLLFITGLSSFAYHNRISPRSNISIQKQSLLPDGVYMVCYNNGTINVYDLSGAVIYTGETGLGPGVGCWKFTIVNNHIAMMIAEDEDGYSDLVVTGKDFDRALVPELENQIKEKLKR